MEKEEKEKMMTGLLILFCATIFFPCSAKLSLMPLKLSLVYSLLWGVAGYFATLLLAELSRQEAFALLDIAGAIMLEFIELLIMAGYIWAKGIGKRLLSLYPGFMVILPISAISFLVARLLPGVDFAVAGLISGSLVFILLAGLTMLFRYAAADANMLYKTILSAAMVNIIIYGLL